MYTREDIRNIAIIAHVDHGKTTLVDALLRQSHTYRDNEKVTDRVMDSNDLEKERGITILSKNTSVRYKDHTINIVDTPGHADFGGEVERVLKMVDSVLLVVDSYEGPMPQTKFVLKKALELGHNPIVLINKIDKVDARPNAVINEVFDLFLELGATDEQCDFTILYASARDGYAMFDPEDKGVDMVPVLDTILAKVKAPQGDIDGSFQMLVSTLDASEYMGKLAIGKIQRGSIRKNMNVMVMNKDGESTRRSVSALFVNNGLKRVETQEAKLGDIVSIAGLGDVSIGDTIADALNPEALPFMHIDEPTLSMNFMVNDSPFAGREGDFVTSRHIRERLMKEIETNVSMRVKELTPDTFEVSGRGELHLSILLETMRREGYEVQVSKPTVIIKEIDGKKMEPMEYLTIDVPEDYVGVVMEKLGTRKAEMVNMTSAVNGYTRLEFDIPARGLIGFRSELMTDTRGNGIMNHVFKGYGPYKGDINERTRGSLIVFETGTAIAYGLNNAQERGTLFLSPGTEVYAGMICGESSRGEDIEVNVCRKKHLSNTRSSGNDDAIKLITPRVMSLENCLEFINNDELVEITPHNIRMRKRILDTTMRKRAARK